MHLDEGILPKKMCKIAEMSVNQAIPSAVSPVTACVFVQARSVIRPDRGA